MTVLVWFYKKNYKRKRIKEPDLRIIQIGPQAKKKAHKINDHHLVASTSVQKYTGRA